MKREPDREILALQAPADPIRLAILPPLAIAGAVSACEIGAGHAVAQPTVFHHLRVLREAGWITGERRGTWIWYDIRPEAMAKFEAITRFAAGPDSGRRLPVVQPSS